MWSVFWHLARTAARVICYRTLGAVSHFAVFGYFTPRPQVAPATFARRDASARVMFLVGSAINIRRHDVAKEQSANVFSPVERFRQTLATLQSIRRAVPDAYIVFSELTPLASEQKSALLEYADLLLDLSGDALAQRYCFGKNKGTAEAYLLEVALLAVDHMTVGKVFKISARYELAHDFAAAAYPEGKIGMRTLYRNWASTRLYCWPGAERRRLMRQLKKCLFFGRLGCSMEEIIWRGVPKSLWHEMPRLGVRGTTAAGAGLIDE